MLLPGAVLAASCTLSPSQKVVLPLADMLPVGRGAAITLTEVELEKQLSSSALTL
jgi:hypothetical protein